MNIKKLNLIAKILFYVMLVIYGLFAVAGPILLTNNTIVNGFLGIQTTTGAGVGAEGATYFDTKYKNMAEVKEASLEIIEETMAEGAVLLKNEDALPLNSGDTVSLYGLASYYSVHTGQGSSGLEANNAAKALEDRVTFYDGLTNAGLKVNADLNNWYSGKSMANYLGENFMGSSTQQYQQVVKDIAWDEIDPGLRDRNANAAVVVLARNSGEAIDLYMDTEMEDGTKVILNKNNQNTSSVGADALELTSAEKSVLEGLKGLKSSGKIDSIVVIMNSASPLQCEFMDDPAYGIDAALWVGTIGTNGADAIGKILTGEVNPSGRLSDTFWANSKYNPVYYNFGAIKYDNSGILNLNYYTVNGDPGNRYYVAYQEGIYNGYKYTETRYEDVLTNRDGAGSFEYDKAVSYPFGYGLSYTNFTYTKFSATKNNNNTYSVTVEVKNNTDIEGKEVVQVYLQKPYTQKDIANGVEKAAVELVGFDKITVPANGTATARIIVEEKYFAAYDANVEKTYVIGSDNKNDEYLLTAAKDAHDAVNNILQYKAGKGAQVALSEIVAYAGRGNGDKNLVEGFSIDYDAKKYSTNDFIVSENEAFNNLEHYDGQEANYGVDKITNQFDDVDFKTAGLFSAEEEAQQYMTRSDWEGTYGKRVKLTATADLQSAQVIPALKQDNIEYPTYNEAGFYESDEVFDDMKLIYLRGRDYNDPMWDTLLDQITWEDTCALLQNGERLTKICESVSAPATSQQNGAIAPVHQHEFGELIKGTGFLGFAVEKDPAHVTQLPPIFLCNGIVASTFNLELIERLGEQTGEEAAWAGYNGIYGLGVNIHRGAYCGRQFEYYSEDGFLTGMAAGYEAVGLHKMGVFVLMKHAVLNDQETHRAGINVWANEQTIREIYGRAIEIAVDIDREYTRNSVLGVMTGMNCMGAKWTGAQGFCNTVLKAEYGMRGYVISDYSKSRYYMSPIQGVLFGNDLTDGQTDNWSGGKDLSGNSAQFADYNQDNGNYGELAWAMRDATHSILYTVVNSNAMNGIDGDSSFKSITPAWEIAVPVLTRVFLVLFIWSTLAFAVTWTLNLIGERSASKKQVSDSYDKSDKETGSEG